MGWQFSLVEPSTCEVNRPFYTPIVAVTPDGKAVGFKGVVEAAQKLNIRYSAILKALRRPTGMLYGWQFFRESDCKGSFEFEELTEETLATFKPSHKIRCHKAKKRSCRRGDDGTERDPHEGETPIMTGFYDKESNAFICPLCKKVMGNGLGKGIRHIEECLKDYDYDIKFHIIRVWKKIESSNISATSSTV